MNDDYQLQSDNWPGLAKIVEETGELNQVLGKLMATGGVRDYYDGSDLEDMANDELGDVLAAMIFFIENNAGLDLTRINNRATEKIYKFQSWREEQRNG